MSWAGALPATLATTRLPPSSRPSSPATGSEPLFPAAGYEARSYRQPFGLASWNVAPTGSIVIERPGERFELRLLRDLQVAFVTANEAWYGTLPLVYVGAGVVEPDLGYDELAGLDLEGACVVILFDLPAIMLRGAPSDLRTRNPAGNEGLIRRVGNAARQGAVCAIAIPGPAAPPFWDAFMQDANQLTSQSSTPPVHEPFVSIAVALSRRGTSRLFAGQLGDPNVDSGLPPFPLRGVTLQFDLELNGTDRLETHNVGALIPGSDAALDDEIIVLMAHLDGQGTQADGVVLNRANDNGASVVALLETTRVLAEAPARRALAVLFTSAEEIGLRGAEHFVDNPPVERSRLALNINLEMVGKRRRSGGDYEFRVAGRHSDDIETLVRATRQRHGGVDFDYERRFETPEYRFRRADHAHFFLRGVPTIYFYGGGGDYHQPSDDADRVEYPKVRTMAEVLVELIRVTDAMEGLPTSDGRP